MEKGLDCKRSMTVELVVYIYQIYVQTDVAQNIRNGFLHTQIED